MRTIAFPIVVLALLLGFRGDTAQAGALASLEKEITDLVAKVRPSVVAIETTVHRKRSPAGRTLRTSGVIIAPDGYIVTVGFGLRHAEKIAVTLHDGSTWPGRLVGVDDKTNVALLKIETNKKLKPATVRYSKTIAVGSWAFVVGNPYGLTGSVSYGIVSGLNRRVRGHHTYRNLIQTTAPVNPGDSGGMLANSKGELVGIVLSTYGRGPSRVHLRNFMRAMHRNMEEEIKILGSPAELSRLSPQQISRRLARIAANRRRLFGNLEPTGGANLADVPSAMGAEGINFAIPAGFAVRIAERLKAGRSQQPRPRWGLLIEPVSPALRAQLGLAEGVGVVVSGVVTGSAAEAAGIRPWDVLVAVGGKKIMGTAGIRDLLGKQRMRGRPINVTLYRAGLQIQLTLAAPGRPGKESSTPKPPKPQGKQDQSGTKQRNNQ